MVALALDYDKGLVFLKDIAKRENISEKYLSQIIIPLRGVGLLSSSRGAYGGYSLAKDPSHITMKEIMDVLEGDFSLVDCVNDPSKCPRAEGKRIVVILPDSGERYLSTWLFKK
jgi:Rrf2 family protein